MRPSEACPLKQELASTSIIFVYACSCLDRRNATSFIKKRSDSFYFFIQIHTYFSLVGKVYEYRRMAMSCLRRYVPVDVNHVLKVYIDRTTSDELAKVRRHRWVYKLGREGKIERVGKIENCYN
ncbi:unnamed protein product [Diatraea saccharalis]|uniref:Uncharacterized protein n=1 Tax=Diatraea saccharalis TaxID=40085 RepID=A0A9N9WLU3_9NEOP|nr:unnamed protein product [Diatraea saccharalis]